MDDNIKHVNKLAQQGIVEALHDAERIRVFYCEKCGGDVEILIDAAIAYSVYINKGLKAAGDTLLIDDDVLGGWTLRCKKCLHEPDDLPEWLREDISRHISYETVTERNESRKRINKGV